MVESDGRVLDRASGHLGTAGLKGRIVRPWAMVTSGAVALSLLLPMTVGASPASASSAPAGRSAASRSAASRSAASRSAAGRSAAGRLVRPVAHVGMAGGAAPGLVSAQQSTQGQRMQTGPRTDASYSGNWSGLGGTGTGIEGAAGAWTVPKIKSSTSARYSATWVGVDGLGNSNLIQTGTYQDTRDGYAAWIEILPAASETIVGRNGRPAPVKPGDKMAASVRRVKAGKWTIFIRDITKKWYFEKDFHYSGPGHSAEWIEEAPTVNGEQSVPPDFGTVHVSDTLLYGNFGHGLGWYSTNLTAGNEIVLLNRTHSRILATPSAPTPASSHGQRFSDTYVTAPGRPTDVKATARRRAVHLAWKKPAHTGGTPIVGYSVHEYRSGRLVRTIAVRTTSTTLGGLTAGARYTFSVAARSFGRYTSRYSPQTRTVRPRA